MPDTSAELVFIGSPDGQGIAEILVASSGNVADAAAVATIAAVAGKMNWLTGFSVSAAGATAALSVSVTVTGLNGGTLTFAFTFPAGPKVTAEHLVVTLPTPIPASAANTAITITLPAAGTGATHADVNLFGFRSVA